MVEHEGMTKSLDEITSPALQALVNPIVRHVEKSLGKDPGFDNISIVFFLDPDLGMQFQIRGDDQHTINRAVDLIGTSAEVRKNDG
ncbi:MAG TPA: hypothetical protein ENH89_02770 [Aurantimonas coralicida]|nr:hypothetical protein [Aurantimonas coralicida]